MAGSNASLDQRMRPELAAGGFTRDDGTIAFYQRVDALLRPDSVVLDLGAGRGAQAERPYYGSRFQLMRGRVAKVIGVDIDPVVMTNPLLDEAHVITAGQPLPFGAETFDVIIADWVLEHIANPDQIVREIHRVLKPGGWFCARTPNKWGCIAIAARLVPDRLEHRALSKVQPDRQERDVFPKFYRMNTLAAIGRHFAPSLFENSTYTNNPTPSYHGGRRWLYEAIQIFQSLPVRWFDTVLLVFMRKKL